MPWEERFALGVADMDVTHQEFVDLADALATAADADFPTRFAELREHTRKHFEHEARLMRRCRFPAIGEHESEHLRVLGELAHLAARVDGGRLTMARAYVEGMPQWFANHLVTMDAALAGCLKAKG
ncbi:MAG: hemerythrin family protein [Azonexus sp.]|jgi:hemerythrin-like metal-binding protein|nr:hemerythrin family protein [Betaproteobacteria bacterium]MBK8919117.1 hemerythrin family protein [Betaproteobacteria bacterium]MBP6036561.1 hemerythrin family protein [Azonexus sp.]MBP6907169.1 hemerythrin family protein [Azonexus sp.]